MLAKDFTGHAAKFDMRKNENIVVHDAKDGTTLCGKPTNVIKPTHQGWISWKAVKSPVTCQLCLRAEDKILAHQNDDGAGKATAGLGERDCGEIGHGALDLG